MIKRFSLIFIVMAMSLAFTDDIAARTVKGVKQQRQTTQREIKETNKKITLNTRNTKRQLNTLNRITAEIAEQNIEIKSLQTTTDSLTARVKELKDSITHFENQYNSLRDNYARAVQNVSSHTSSLDKMLFIFSSDSFRQAVRRLRYLKQFSIWRNMQAEQIRSTRAILVSKRATLENTLSAKSATLGKMNLAHKRLKEKKGRQENVIDNLRNEAESLKSLLAEQKRKAAALDRELERLIAEEERKAAERRKKELAEEKNRKKDKEATSQDASTEPKRNGYQMSSEEITLSGSFESNKGKLPAPVAGEYKIVRPFGRHKHPELKYVVTDNGGIDIETDAGTKARAIFNGKVSAIFQPDGYNIVVMVRHGNYLTIYANLSKTFVVQGQTLKAGEQIGEIYSDPEDDNRTILHFEIRKERQKLNPSLWLK